MSVRGTLCLLLFLLMPSAKAELKVVVLDVAEGQAILMQRGERGVLIDTGHAGMASRVLGRMQLHGVKQLDYLFLSHLHPDHAGGYFRIREAFPKTVVLDSHHPLPVNVAPDMVRWVNEALAGDSRRKKVQAGDGWSWQKVDMRVLWPRRFQGHNLNGHSLVLRFNYGESTILLMGDAGKQVESQLLKGAVAADAKVGLYVAGHHGAADAGSELWLEYLSPYISVISVNQNNIRGYPSAETVKTVKRYSQKLLRTDQDGEVCLLFTQQRPQPSSC